MIIVFGSINMDLVVRSPRIPVAGETITGHDFYTAPGGKGANQAVASARLGARTSMVGRVGNDVFASALLKSLQDNHVEISRVSQDEGNPSGVAIIAVDDQSENSIVVVPGTNGAVGGDDVSRLEQLLGEAQILLLQLEIPLDAVLAACQSAGRAGVKVILDPAPAKPLPDELIGLCDFITPNEIEAGMLVGFPIDSIDHGRQAAEVLLNRGAGNVIIKMGAQGAYWSDGEQSEFFQAYEVNAVDSVAAGDAFNGGLAVGLAEGYPVSESIAWGMAAGALSTTRLGAQPSMPDRSEVIALMNHQNIR